jgi:phosphatidylethanolamine-binding protein (PEBP) family uncharacterized protein
MTYNIVLLPLDAFKDGSSIPVEHTCDGEDSSPALSWDNVPAGIQFIALIVDDPDAPGKTWVHTSNHRPML